MKALVAIVACSGIFLCGCKDLKDQQVDAYVGDTQTKVYYKNVGDFATKVPKERRIYFRSMEEAMEQGYQSYQEGGDEPETLHEEGGI